MLLCIGALASAGCANSADPGDSTADNNRGGMQLAVEIITSGLKSPVHLSAPKDDRRLFVVEQAGVIRIIRERIDPETLELPRYSRLRPRLESSTTARREPSHDPFS